MEKSAMPKKERRAEDGCCRVESIVSVDERGQMVLPKEIREAAGIRPGDKLAVVLWRKENRVCCLTLIRAEELVGMVKDRLGPVLKDIIS
jgi:AbrB family looped-hinge helix DNA binding protein